MMTSIIIGQSQRDKETREPDDAISITSGSEEGREKRPAMDLARGLPTARWSDDGSLEHAFIASVRHLADQHQLDLSVLHGDGTNTVAKKGGDGIGYSGHKHQKGEKVIAIIDNHGYVLAPLPVAPVNEADTVLLPEGLKALKRVAKLTGLRLQGAYLNLDGGFDSRHNRKAIFNAGMIPNIKANPRNRKTTKRVRKRFFHHAIHALRMRVERTFAW